MRSTPTFLAAAGALAAFATLPVGSAPLQPAEPPETPLGQADEMPPGWPAAHPDVVEGRFVAVGGHLGEEVPACTSCHQLDGTGDRSGAFPRLTDQSGWYLYSTLRDFASGLRPSEIMGPIARQLSDGQMQDVAAFYASLEDEPYPPHLTEDADLLKTGEAIAASGVPEAGVPPCTSCHGQNGVGNGLLYPFLAGQYGTYLEHQLLLWKAGRRGGDPMNVMEAIAKQLSDDQIHAVSHYFASLRPEEVTPQEILAGGAEPPAAEAPGAADRTPHVGAVIDPEPGKGDVVVPDAPPIGGDAGRP